MEYKLTLVRPDKLREVLLSIPASKLGRETSSEVLKLRADLQELKTSVVNKVDKGVAIEVDVMRLEKNKRVPTGKKRKKYSVLIKYQSAAKYVNDNAKDGSRLYLFNDIDDEYYIVKISSEDLKKKEYFSEYAGPTRFSITKWRKATAK